jgi:hypothetical protein
LFQIHTKLGLPNIFLETAIDHENSVSPAVGPASTIGVDLIGEVHGEQLVNPSDQDGSMVYPQSWKECL